MSDDKEERVFDDNGYDQNGFDRDGFPPVFELTQTETMLLRTSNDVIVDYQQRLNEKRREFRDAMLVIKRSRGIKRPPDWAPDEDFRFIIKLDTGQLERIKQMETVKDLQDE